VAAKKSPSPASVSTQATRVDSVPDALGAVAASSMKPPPPVISSRKSSCKKIETKQEKFELTYMTTEK
jgi:hypothetical protein